VYPCGVCSTIVEAAAVPTDTASADATTKADRFRVFIARVLLRFARG
jgi:hypothetical protein